MRGAGAAFAFLALAAGVGVAVAAPALSFKTRPAKVAIIVDPRLRAHPGLYENCRAEGRRWAIASRDDALAEYKDNRDAFRDGQRWEYERNYKLRSFVARRYVSVLREESSHTGAAHPEFVIDTILWDRETRKRINVRRFFAETADDGPTMRALATLVRVAVVTEKFARKRKAAGENGEGEPAGGLPDAIDRDGWVAEAIQPRLLELGPIALAPSTAGGKSSGFTIHFSPDAVDVYAAGPYTVFIPWTAFERFLSSDGRAIFAGERPAKDSEED